MKYDALLVTKPENIFYLTRFPMPEDARVLALSHHARQDATETRVNANRRILFTDTRYLEEIASLQEKGIEVRVTGTGRFVRDALKDALKAHGVRTLGVEGRHMPVETFFRMQKEMKKSGVKTVTTHGVVEDLRIIKTDEEMKSIRTACELSVKALETVLPRIRAGMRERAIARMLEKTMRELGADGPAFPFIVASGVRGAHPHGIASEKKIARGEAVTIDFGAKVAGYHADMTRTFFMGQHGRLETVEKSKDAPRELRKIYATVARAQAMGIRAVRAGRQCREIDRVTRRVIAREGYGEYFVHSTGHGVGLEIHEAPTLSEKSRDRLRAGMVVTVEPGIYIPGVGGVRIEDTMIVRRKNAEVITR